MIVAAWAPSLDRPRPVLGLAHLVGAIGVDCLGVDLVERPVREVGVEVGERPSSFLVVRSETWPRREVTIPEAKAPKRGTSLSSSSSEDAPPARALVGGTQNPRRTSARTFCSSSSARAAIPSVGRDGRA